MVNNLGVDPDEWFRESIPMNEDPPYSDNFKSGLPDGGPNFSWEDTAPSEYEPPDDDYKPSEFADLDWFTDEKPKKEESIHEKMYQIATAKYNPFAVGGSENLGGSENVQDK